jgi:hypothetical protein
MKKKPESTELDQILARLSVEQSRAVLHTLAQDPNLAPLILEEALRLHRKREALEAERRRLRRESQVDRG